MKTKLIILRQEKPSILPTQPGSRWAMPTYGPSEIAPAVLRLDVEESPSRRVLDAVHRDKTVLNAATALPMKLIEPFPCSAIDEPEFGEATWGLNAVGALRSPFDGRGVTVAVLDTGIDSSHPAFHGVQVEERDFTDSGNGDAHGHGTHCAGTIFGRAVDGRRIGVAPGVSRALIGKVLGGSSGGSSDQVVEGILWAQRGEATVISMSLGIDFPGYVEYLVNEEGYGIPQATSVALEAYAGNVRMFERLASFLQEGMTRPVVLVAAAGNESGRHQVPPFAINTAPPAASVGIVAVGALGREDGGFSVAPFSNARPTVAAPGVEVLSAQAGGGLRRLSGTSMATPHVAGVAALWAEKLNSQRSLSSARLQAQLITSGTLNGLKAGMDSLDVGSGLVQAPTE